LTLDFGSRQYLDNAVSISAKDVVWHPSFFVLIHLRMPCLESAGLAIKLFANSSAVRKQGLQLKIINLAKDKLGGVKAFGLL